MPKQNGIDFKFSVLLACIVLDLVDYLVDAVQATGGDIPIFGAAVDVLGGSIDLIAVIVGLLFFAKMKAGIVVSTIAVIDPIITDALPLYTVSYLLASGFDLDSAKIKKIIGA
jgi:hypothetical protein